MKRNNFLPLNSILPEIGVTKQTFKKLEAIQMVREQREQHKQDIAYHARPFVLCGIPLRRPPADHITHARRNGNFALDIVGHPRYGLPFGQDRLIPIWVATLAVLQRSRFVRFASPSALLDYFELPKNGYHYKRIVEGFQRIFGATIFFGTEGQHQRAAVSDSVRFHFFDRMQLWYNREEPVELDRNERYNTITLSEAFHNEIDRHKIPVERRVVVALANAPGTLDLYVWLVWRSWSLAEGQRARIPLFGTTGLAQQLGSKEYGRDRDFRQKLAKWLREVKEWWPECPAAGSPDGRFLILSSARGSPAVNAPSDT
ncbi:MAG: replication protein RepA [Terriglobia bacterium]